MTLLSELERKRIRGVMKRANLHDHIVEALGARIVNGGFGDNHALPTEPELAAEFGVSRNALREAIKVLSSKGLVEVRPKTGTRLRPKSEWSLLDRDVLKWAHSSDGHLRHVFELTEFRLIFEPAASSLAAIRGSDDEIKKILDACAELEACVGKPLEYMSEVDQIFHQSVLAASHNEILVHLGALIAPLMQIQVVQTSDGAGLFESGLPQHRALADAIASHDPVAAETVSRDLVRAPYMRMAAKMGMKADQHIR